MIGTLTFADKNLAEFGVICSGLKTHGSAERAYTTVEIPGRNGDLLMKLGRLKNISVSYECSISPLFTKETDFTNCVQDLRNYLMTQIGYRKLSDSYHTDEYRLACYAGPFEADVLELNLAGTFTLTFNCKPERYLISGDIPTVLKAGESATLTNPTGFVSSPLITVYTLTDTKTSAEPIDGYISTGETLGHKLFGSKFDDAVHSYEVQDTGNSSAISTDACITIGDYRINTDFSDHPNETICIDCDAKRAYTSEGVIMSEKIYKESFPVIGTGKTKISNYTAYPVNVYPRWWRL